MGTEAASLFETLDLMGVGTEAATDRMEEVIKSSQNIVPVIIFSLILMNSL